ncbi:MAG: hypothetical protein HY287_03735 [Planctomycetes bacterium]|nr:hypothetical protein [Planctomycetota bacterium]
MNEEFGRAFVSTRTNNEAGRSPAKEELHMGMMGGVMMAMFAMWMMFFGGMSFMPFGIRAR